MEYYAGLDVSMEETHICVLDREGALIREGKTRSSPAMIAAFLADGPPCEQVIFETGRMAPMLYHGLIEQGVPVQCVESRQAYQALKSLAGHRTDRNDARGLAHLARTGFYKPTHVKSLSAHAIRSLIAARKKLVGQSVTIDNQISGTGRRVRRSVAARLVAGIQGRGAEGQRWRAGSSCRALRALCSTRSHPHGGCGNRCRHEKDGPKVQGLRAPHDDSRCWPHHSPGFRGRS
ncbi:Transposase [Salinihabitans flavidus]|uniref:Transposase n=1 Tax=Salinihabitans flavidus TaxID=569882 RepID=A0A1H8W3J3_9RHOB|nr:Transposase [Salinihabitans flavidus]